MLSEEEKNLLLRNIWNGRIHERRLPRNLYIDTGNELRGGWMEGFGAFSKEEAALFGLGVSLNQNVYRFSAAKTFQQVKDMSNFIVDSDGFIRPFRDFKASVDPIYSQFNEQWLRTEFDTAVGQAQSAQQWQQIQANKDVLPLLQYQTALDSLVRPEHAAWEGIVRPVDDPFWDDHMPPNGWNCYLGDTKIASKVVGAQRSHYTGKVIEIITSGGKHLTVTPNHGILTVNGFIAANKITNGDNVVCDSSDVSCSIAMVDDYIYKEPTRAADIFSTLDKMFGSKQILTVGLDFDGDAKWFDSQVDIIDINRELLGYNNFTSTEDLGKFTLHSTNKERLLVDSFSSLNLLSNRMLSTPAGIMCLLYLPFSLLTRHSIPFRFFSFGLTPQDGASRYKVAPDTSSGDTEFLAELINADPSVISLDNVVKVRELDFSGHVYDFTSLNGINIANNIYTSNCRCTTSQLEQGEEPVTNISNVVKNQDPLFTMNPGEERLIFREKGRDQHPYFTVQRSDIAYRNRNFDLPLPTGTDPL